MIKIISIILVLFLSSTLSEAALVGHWKFNDGSGSSAVDSSGNGNTGTLNNSPSWVAGRLNGALGFNGVDQYVTTGSPATTVTENWAVSMWIFRTGSSSVNMALMTNGVSGSNGYGMFLAQSTGFDLQVEHCGQSLQVTDGAAIPLNTWTHLVCTKNATDTQCYRNGSAIGAATASTDDPPATRVTIGGLSTSSVSFNGYIDDVRVYDQNLTPAQVSTLYHGGDPSLIGWWKLDEGSGVSAADSTGNANTGTLVNGPVWISGKRGANALTFNGTNQSVTASDASLPSGASPRTMSVWVKSTRVHANAEYGNFIDYGPGTAQNNSIIGTGNDNNIGDNKCAASQFADGVGGSTFINDGKWHNCLATFDGTTWKIYTDGRLEASKVMTTSTTLTGTLRIGRGTGAFLPDYYEGSIDDVRIYDRVLSDQEIKNLIGSVTIRGATRVNGFKMK